MNHWSGETKFVMLEVEQVHLVLTMIGRVSFCLLYIGTQLMAARMWEKLTI